MLTLISPPLQDVARWGAAALFGVSPLPLGGSKDPKLTKKKREKHYEKCIKTINIDKKMM